MNRNINQLVKNNLSAFENNIEIMEFREKENIIFIKYSYLSYPYKYMCFGKCEYEIIKTKGIFGNIKTELRLLYFINR